MSQERNQNQSATQKITSSLFFNALADAIQLTLESCFKIILLRKQILSSRSVNKGQRSVGFTMQVVRLFIFIFDNGTIN